MAQVSVPCIEIKQRGHTFFQTKINAGVLVNISYAAVRGVHNEEGAIQRILNRRRINSVKEFYLSGGDAPNNVVLNWTENEVTWLIDNSTLTFQNTERSAQIIDGQHRIAGLRAAIEEQPEMADLPIPVALYFNLSTQECADIFLSINTEQKPVPRSLVFDLYGVASAEIVDETVVRASDLITSLNEIDNSPYKGFFKFPGAPRTRGGIALSTAITELKPLLEDKGDFAQIGLGSLEQQTQALLNYWCVVSEGYGSKWGDTQNAFLFAAGFSGGIDFFRRRMIPYCNNERSFSVETMMKVLRVPRDDLILQSEVKGLGGRDAPAVIFDRLNSFFDPSDDEDVQFDL